MKPPLTLDTSLGTIRDADRKLVAYCIGEAPDPSIEDIFRGLTGRRVRLTLPLRTGPREQGLDAGILDADGRVLCYVGWDDAAEVIGRLTEVAL